MIIEIHDSQDAEPKFLGEVLARLAQHHHVSVANIYINKRNTDGRRDPLGWIEYLMLIRYRDGGKMTVGALQRGVDQPTEFHS